MSVTRQWFQPGEGIAREVITADIQRYLGPDALVRPGVGTGEYEGVDGYWITAYRTLTSQMVQDLRLDSQRWRAEVAQGRVAYQDSRTHQSRQYYGPTTPAPAPEPQYAPQQQAYRAPTQPTYSEPSYTYTQPPAGYVQQGNQYVPAPGYGQGQVRTAPTYTYSHQPGQEPHNPYGHQDPRGAYGYPPSSSAPPREQVYAAPPQQSTAPTYYTNDGRTYTQQPPHQANDSRRRR